MSDPAPGNPLIREPDAVCHTPSGRIGVEVAAGHYDSEEAENLWSHLRGHPERSKRTLLPSMEPARFARTLKTIANPSSKLAANLNRTMRDHAAKQYSVPTYLLLDGRGAFITPSDEADVVVALLDTPPNHPFEAIFVALNRNWSTEVDFFKVA